MDIPEQAIKLGLSLAKTIKTKQDNGIDVNSTKVVITDGMGEWSEFYFVNMHIQKDRGTGERNIGK